MSGYQHKEGKGSVRPNQYKTDDRHPDFKGDGMFNGVVFEIAMWARDNGGFSLSIGPKKDRSAPPPSRGGNDGPDSIPFAACKE